MKKMMNRLAACALALVAFQASGLALAETKTPPRRGDKGGNGGAGVRINGVPMTFYSAGIVVEPGPQSIESVPGLRELSAAVDRMGFLAPSSRIALLNAIMPSPQHRYYRVDVEHFDETKLREIKAEYQRVTGVDVSTVELYAVTDTAKRETYLLPAFYELQEIGQQAILFHEADWLLHPDASYGQITTTEAALQAYLENPADESRVIQFMERFSTAQERVRYAILSDLASGALRGLVDARGYARLSGLLGQRFLNCKDTGPFQAVSCSVHLNRHLSGLREIYPRSLFLKVVHEVAIPRDPAKQARVKIGSADVGANPPSLWPVGFGDTASAFFVIDLNPRPVDEFNSRCMFNLKAWNEELRQYIYTNFTYFMFDSEMVL